MATNTGPGDSRRISKSDAFQAANDGKHKCVIPRNAAGATPRTDSTDHNFDTLRKCPVSTPSGVVGMPKFPSGNNTGEAAATDINMDADIMSSGRKSLPGGNAYLREYQEKYGKLGIFRDDDLQSTESRMLCFPFFKDNLSRRIPGRRSFIGSDRPDSFGHMSTAESWDPALMDSRSRIPAVSPRSSSPVTSPTDMPSNTDAFGMGHGNIAWSSGSNWNCSVFGSTEKRHGNQFYPIDTDIIPTESSATGSQTYSVNNLDGSPRDYVKRLAKSNVSILAKTALRELEVSFAKQPECPKGAQGNSEVIADQLHGTPLQELAALASLSRADVVLPGQRLADNSIPVINIGKDYESNDNTLGDGSSSVSRIRRRAVSDLGFNSREPGIIRTPRTAALLSSPAFKKHLAKNMGISEEDLNEKDFQYDFKLNLPGQAQMNTVTSETEMLPGSRLAAVGLRERLLHNSVSDSKLHPPSCLNLSVGVFSNSDSSFNSLNRSTVSDSCDSEVDGHSEVKDLSTATISTLNTGFTIATTDSTSEATSTAPLEGSPGKVKFHIPSFREFRQQRTHSLSPRIPANTEHPSFEFSTEQVINEESKSEPFEMVKALKGDSKQRIMTLPDEFDPHSEMTLVNALNSDLWVGEDHRVDVPGQFVDDPILVYDPTKEVMMPEDATTLEPPKGFGNSRYHGSERRSKRSHRFVSRTKGVASTSDYQGDSGAECGHNSQDNRGKHRKEPNRRSTISSGYNHEAPRESQSHLILDGHQHQEVKVTKEFKIKDTSKGHSGDSKVTIVMAKQEAAKDVETSTGRLTNRPPRPERRKPKDEPSRDETYIIQEAGVTSMVEQYDIVGESTLSRDGSRSSTGWRSSSRSSKKHNREDSGSRDDCKDVRSQPEFDDKVTRGQARDSLEGKNRSSHLQRSSRRSSRRRFIPKTDAVDERSARDTASPPSTRTAEDEADYKLSDLPTFPLTTPGQLAVENSVVTRSVSDISDKKEQRMKGPRERRQKLYKSDPFHDTATREAPPAARQGTLDVRTPLTKEDLIGCQTSREEILTLIQNTKIGGATTSSLQSLDSYYDLSSECAGSTARTQSPGPPSPSTHSLSTQFPNTHSTSTQFHGAPIHSTPSSSTQSLSPQSHGTPSTGTPSPGTPSRRSPSPGSRSPILFRHFPKYSLYPPLSPLWGRKCRSEDEPSGVEVERVDSGVGPELKDSSSSKEFKGGPVCEDCEGDLTSDNMSSDSDFLCRKCESRRVERKETIQEIVDTEVSYGKDLKIIKEEFYLPMETAGLLNADQLRTVFSNLEELITINERFADQLQDSLELANEQGDEDYNMVHVGSLFLEASNMLLAFETYCVNQALVPGLLEKLEEEKELLRIFLHVSQTDNSLLRRMNLRSFLMVPVQRVMKYPLLLSRLHKATSPHHEDRDSIRRAQGRVEDILEHINSQSRGGNNATMRLRRKISGLSVIKKTGSADDIEINKMAIEVLGWNRKDVNFVLSGRVQFTQPADHLWMKKGRALKFLPAYALLLTLGRSTGERWTGRLLFSKSSGIQDAALVLIKEKAGKFFPLRDPLKLERCVVSVDPECDEVFEIMDSNKESFLFKGEDRKDTQNWLRHLKLQTKDLGSWRKRRNALPNIMIHSSKS